MGDKGKTQAENKTQAGNKSQADENKTQATGSKPQERKRPYKLRKPGAGRKSLKPDYNAVTILQEQMQVAVALYTNNSLQTIADTLSLNPIKVRKLLITAGVYESETADAVNSAFEAKQGIPYKEALEAVAAELNLSKASVTLYLPYKKACISERIVI